MISALRKALSERLRSPTPYPSDRFEGRGIVICAGGPRYFTCAWVLISLLRRVYRIELPIQVWHLGRREMSEEMRLLLEEESVEVVDAETVIARYPARVSGGWPLKPYAIQHSRFREVLYLDADTAPLVDPLSAFDWPLYRDGGLLTWPDIVDLKATNPIWEMLGLAPREQISIEAGLLVVDKQRAWDVLDVATLLNEHADAIYGAIYGDKDTFLLASLLLGRAPVSISHRPFVVDSDLVQRDPAGDPFIQHRTGSKWRLGDTNRPLVVEALMPACQRALDELGECWSGDIFHPPAQSQRARDEEARFIALRSFRYEPLGSDARRLELLPAGRVGEGRGVFEQHWAVVERDGAFVLQFFSTSRLTIELTPSGDGSWQGTCVLPAAFSVRLIDEPSRRSWPHEGATRVTNSAEVLVAGLINPSLFAAGFDRDHLSELKAALSLINDRYDDVPEQIDATLVTTVPEPWRTVLSDFSATLMERRDKRVALAARSSPAPALNWSGYERIP
jgi:hypothetical protein